MSSSVFYTAEQQIHVVIGRPDDRKDFLRVILTFDSFHFKSSFREETVRFHAEDPLMIVLLNYLPKDICVSFVECMLGH